MVQIGLITDFGMRGMHYVAEMKGVAIQINSQVSLIDITHTITPYSVVEATYVLYTVFEMYPKDTIFVCVVDPGVGTNRDIVAVELISGHIIIGPDNGIFTYFVLKKLIKMIIKINADDYYYYPPPRMIGKMQDLLIPTAPISSTFHGRDIMMPIAAHLANGLDLYALGEVKDEVEYIEDFDPEVSDDGLSIIAIIQYIDSFSNIITNIPLQEFQVIVGEMPCQFEFEIKDQKHPIFRSTYFAGFSPDLYLLIDGSSGFLEISLNRDKAAEQLKAVVGQRITLRLIRITDHNPLDELKKINALDNSLSPDLDK
jgi:S-adenosylmethionine hydrolase